MQSSPSRLFSVVSARFPSSAVFARWLPDGCLRLGLIVKKIGVQAVSQSKE